MKILLSGATGVMGGHVLDLLSSEPGMDVVAGTGLDSKQPLPFPIYSNPNDCALDVDCIIDFSHPSLLDALIDFAVARKIPAVICTTGFGDKTRQKMKEASKVIPIFHSKNMSLGIHLMLRLIQQARQFLGDAFDVEIIEQHHRRKIDAPSGTALMLAEALESVSPSESTERIYGREGIVGPRQTGSIGIHAIRGGTITGIHEVLFAGEDETIRIEHSASSRKVFAKGAVEAAKFIANCEPGSYDMNDLLSSKGIG
jgi:4-hydroxy-tetrahydrodipicolinate reductase